MKKLKIILFLAAVIALTFTASQILTSKAKEANNNIPIEISEEKSKETYSNLDSVTLPKNTPSQIKKYTGFKISFNKKNHTPNYSAWKILKQNLDGQTPRYKTFWQDTEINGCPNTQQYTRSGYDRGHLAPAADMKYSPQAMKDCFAMSNITPQHPRLNSGQWNTLEKTIRKWAERDSALYIVAGPIYEPSDTNTLPNTKIRIPSAFFKVIIAPYLQSPRGIAFIYPNIPSPGNMQNYAMTIDEAEIITKFDFFPTLPTDLQNKIESTTSFKEWNKP